MTEILNRARHIWNMVIMGTGSIFMLLGTMLVVADSSGRYFFNSPINGATEANQILLAFIGYPAFAYAMFKNQHVRVILITSRVPHLLRAPLEIFAACLGLGLCIVLIWGGWNQFWASWTVREVMAGLVPLPFWLPKLIMPVGIFFFAVEFVFILMQHIHAILKKEAR